jgi:hypothetical protein
VLTAPADPDAAGRPHPADAEKRGGVDVEREGDAVLAMVLVVGVGAGPEALIERLLDLLGRPLYTTSRATVAAPLLLLIDASRPDRAASAAEWRVRGARGGHGGGAAAGGRGRGRRPRPRSCPRTSTRVGRGPGRRVGQRRSARGAGGGGVGGAAAIAVLGPAAGGLHRHVLLLPAHQQDREAPLASGGQTRHWTWRARWAARRCKSCRSSASSWPRSCL